MLPPPPTSPLFPYTTLFRTARAHGMLVMVGCMIETSLGITAAAHFTPLVDAADLDGAALTTNNPFAGATIDGGQIRLPTGPRLAGPRRCGGPRRAPRACAR